MLQFRKYIIKLHLQVWEQSFGVNIIDAASQQIYDASKLADQLVMACKTAKTIGFIGLGAMGFGMASHLLKSGFSIIAYDVRILPNCIIGHSIFCELQYKKSSLTASSLELNSIFVIPMQ